MTTIAVVQARMGSTRLPGKVLMDLGGQPVLGLQLARLVGLVGSQVDELVVATSSEPSDDPVVALADAAGVGVVRGSESDVLDRFGLAIERYRADTVVRLTGDCPLSDPAIVADALTLHRRAGSTYTSNTLVRTFPDGLDVEVIEAEALEAARAAAVDADQREHVTPFVYQRPERFTLRALRHHEPLGDERWTIDTEEDLADLRQILARIDDPIRATWLEVLAVAGRRRRPGAGELWLRPLMPGDLDSLGRLSEAPPPAAAQFDDPATRWWTVDLDGQAIGWLGVVVNEGRAESLGWVPDGHDQAARKLLARALAADRQVVTLTGSFSDQEPNRS